MNVVWKSFAILLFCAGGALIVGCSKNGAAQQDVVGEELPAARTPIVLAPSEGQVIVQSAGAAHVDATSGNLCWPAMTCTLPGCASNTSSGKPYLFPFKLEGTSIDAEGSIVWPSAGLNDPEKWAYCPVCGSREGVRPYEPSEVVERRADLLAELARSRAAFKTAREHGQTSAANHRTPQAILDELASLPKVFLIDDGRFDSLGN